MKKAVFFDLGGTLLVMRRDRIFQRVLRDEGYRLDLKQIRISYAKMEPVWMEVLPSRFATAEEAVEVYRRLDVMVIEDLSVVRSHAEAGRLSALVRSRWDELGKTFPAELYPDVVPVLGRLRSRGIKLGLVSNAPPDTAQTVEELGLNRYIEHIIISGIVGYSKPNPEIFRIALAGASVSAQEAVHVGDVYAADVVGARNAGMEGVLLDRDRVAGNVDCPTIHELGEVIPIIEGRG